MTINCRGTFFAQIGRWTRSLAFDTALCELQDKLYAQDTWAVLLIFQAMATRSTNGGVELGKQLPQRIIPELAGKEKPALAHAS